MLKRVDEIFLRSTESAAMDNDLIESINNIRFMRFETALREALLVAKEPEQPNPNGNNGVTISSTGSNNKELLKQHLLEILGPSYMTYHSVGQGPTLHLEDARAALKAFWRISERRLHEDVISVVEIILLKKSSEMVEQELLSIYQNWLLDPDELDSVLQENEVVVNERRKLKALKTSVEAALKQLDEVLPHCKAKSVEL